MFIFCEPCVQPVAELSVGPGVAAALPQICHALHYPGWFTCHISMVMQLIKAGSSDDSTVPHLAFHLSSTTVCSNCCGLAQRRLQQVLIWLSGRNSAETGVKGERLITEYCSDNVLVQTRANCSLTPLC